MKPGPLGQVRIKGCAELRKREPTRARERERNIGTVLYTKKISMQLKKNLQPGKWPIHHRIIVHVHEHVYDYVHGQ